MTDDELVAALATLSVPVPDLSRERLAGIQHHVRRRRAHLRWIRSSVLCATVAFALGGAVVVHIERASANETTASQVYGTASLDFPHTTAQAQARDIVALDAAAVPPGALIVADPVNADVADPGGLGVSDIVDLTREWTAPGGVPTTLAWLAAHPPAGYELGATVVGQDDNSPTRANASFNEYIKTLTAAPSLLITVRAAPEGRVVFRVDAQIPLGDQTRLAATAVRGAQVTVYARPHAYAVHSRHISADAAGVLASLVNAQPTADVGLVSCSITKFDASVWQLRFVTRSGHTEVVGTMPGCFGAVIIDGQFGRTISFQLSATIAADVGLPAGAKFPY